MPNKLPSTADTGTAPSRTIGLIRMNRVLWQTLGSAAGRKLIVTPTMSDSPSMTIVGREERARRAREVLADVISCGLDDNVQISCGDAVEAMLTFSAEASGIGVLDVKTLTGIISHYLDRDECEPSYADLLKRSERAAESIMRVVNGQHWRWPDEPVPASISSREAG